MARTAETVQAEIDELRKLYAQGVVRTEHGDQTTVFPSGDDLLKRITALERELARLGGTHRTHRLAVISKGF